MDWIKELAKFDVNEKRFTISVPFEQDESLCVKSWSEGDKVVMIGDIKIAEPVFKTKDHPKWYEICHYDGITDTHKILARIQVDLIEDTVKPLDTTKLPDVSGVRCDKCGIELGTIHHNINLVTEHLSSCGGKFVKK